MLRILSPPNRYIRPICLFGFITKYGKVILFRAQRNSSHPLRRIPYGLGWSKQAKTKMQIHPAQGSHREILNYQYVEPIAQTIENYLKQLKNVTKE